MILTLWVHCLINEHNLFEVLYIIWAVCIVFMFIQWWPDRGCRGYDTPQSSKIFFFAQQNQEIFFYSSTKIILHPPKIAKFDFLVQKFSLDPQCWLIRTTTACTNIIPQDITLLNLSYIRLIFELLAWLYLIHDIHEWNCKTLHEELRVYFTRPA